MAFITTLQTEICVLQTLALENRDVSVLMKDNRVSGMAFPKPEAMELWILLVNRIHHV